jgi:hypothetical protein
MALESVSSDALFGRCWPMTASGGGGWSWGHGHGVSIMEGAMDLEGGSAAAWDVGAGSSVLVPKVGEDEPGGSSPAPSLAHHRGVCGGNAAAAGAAEFAQDGAPPMPAAGTRKRRRARSVTNREEAESQRLTHIAVERNRRKQMNEYLSVLRSVMPPSYVQRVSSTPVQLAS